MRALIPRSVPSDRREVAVTVVLWVLIANVVLSVIFNLKFGGNYRIAQLNGVAYDVFENVAQIILMGWVAGRATLAAVREQDLLKAQMRQTNLEMLGRLAQTAECRDDLNGGHNGRIGQMAAVLATVYGYTEYPIEEIVHAASLHDIGKIAVPDPILRKRGPLDEDERHEMQKHTIIGSTLLENGGPAVELARKVARWHHERWDGLGYPDGLKGSEIPVIARIVAVCDVFDALLSARPYKEAWAWDDAVNEIQSLSGTRFDPDVVAAFSQSLVSLRRIWMNGRVAVELDVATPDLLARLSAN